MTVTATAVRVGVGVIASMVEVEGVGEMVVLVRGVASGVEEGVEEVGVEVVGVEEGVEVGVTPCGRAVSTTANLAPRLLVAQGVGGVLVKEEIVVVWGEGEEVVVSEVVVSEVVVVVGGEVEVEGGVEGAEESLYRWETTCGTTWDKSTPYD